MAGKQSNVVAGIVLGFCGLFGIWGIAALIGGIKHAGSVSALAQQYMVATGMITPLNTMVDYYTHIKGIEYLICAAFFVIFPFFFRYVNKEKAKVPVKK